MFLPIPEKREGDDKICAFLIRATQTGTELFAVTQLIKERMVGKTLCDLQTCLKSGESVSAVF
jgi:hypothetical protein